MTVKGFRDRIKEDEDGVKRLTIPIIRAAYAITGIKPRRGAMCGLNMHGVPSCGCGMGAVMMACGIKFPTLGIKHYATIGIDARYANGFWRGFDGHEADEQHLECFVLAKGYADGKRAGKEFIEQD
jgi:hypothetical protein